MIIIGCKKKENGSIPVVITTDISHIAITSAQCGGSITDNGGSEVTASGVCWSIVQTPTIEDYKSTDNTISGSFTSSITSLAANSTYFVRAYATNSAGTAYGDVKSFTTYRFDAVSDCEGNYYNVVTIGTQVWMAENLKTTHYCNGDPIPEVTDSAQWYNQSTGAYCNYANNANIAATYGRLYNWYAVTDNRGLVPVGWHVPTENDLNTLKTFLGINTAGGKLKEAGTVHWMSPNTGATNESGFTALPGGDRQWPYAFGSLGTYGNWWTSTEFDLSSGIWLYIHHTSTVMSGGPNYKVSGFSVRCIKD